MGWGKVAGWRGGTGVMMQALSMRASVRVLSDPVCAQLLLGAHYE